MADLTKKQIIEAERAERKAASEQAKKDLQGRANALKAEKAAQKEKEDADKAAQKLAIEQASKAQEEADKKAEERAKAEAKKRREEQVEKRKKGIEDDKKDRELHDRSFEDRQKKHDDRLNRRLDLEEARDKEGSIRFLADQMSEGKAGAVDEANNANLAAKLRDMNAFTNIDADEEARQYSNEMSGRFNELSEVLKNPESSDDEKRMAQLQLDELSKAADDEEERREKKAEADKMNSLWGRMEQGINRSADNLEGMRNNLLKGGGIVAVLGTLALLFMDPETLFEAIKSGLEIVRNIIQGIKDFIAGDMSTKLQMVKDNIWPIIGAITLLAILFLPSILRGFVTLGNVASGIGKFLTIMKRGFMIVRGLIFGAATANAVAGGGVLAMFSAALVPLAPVIAIGLAIVAAVALFGWLMTKLRDALGFSSVFDLVWVGIAYVKDGIAHFGNVFIRIANTVMSWIGKVAKWFGFEVEMPQMEEMKTNNAEIAKSEARAKKKKKDEEKAAEEKKKAEKEAEEKALAEGSDLKVDIEVEGPSDDELKKQEEVDKFRKMMGFKQIEREKLVNELTTGDTSSIVPTDPQTGEQMIESSASNAQAQADAAGRPDAKPDKKPMMFAQGGNTSTVITHNTLAKPRSRAAGLNMANQ